MHHFKFVLWAMQGVQMLAWAWFNWRGGNLRDRQYLAFAAGLMLGQIGGGIEAGLTHTWGPVVTQVYFFITTVWGAYKRFQTMRAASRIKIATTPTL